MHRVNPSLKTDAVEVSGAKPDRVDWALGYAAPLVEVSLLVAPDACVTATAAEVAACLLFHAGALCALSIVLPTPVCRVAAGATFDALALQ